MSTADELVEAMDADGVDASVVMGMGWTDHGLAVEVNDYLAESVRRYPGRLYGFGGVSPAWGGPRSTGGRAVRRRRSRRCRRAAPRHSGLRHWRRTGDGPSDGGGATPGPHRDHSLVGAGWTSLPRQGGHTALSRFGGSFLAVSRSHHSVRPLGRRPALLRTDAVGRREPGQTCTSTRRHRRSCTRPRCSPPSQRWPALGASCWAADYPLLRVRRLIDEARRTVASEDDLAAIFGGNAERLLAGAAGVGGALGSPPS